MKKGQHIKAKDPDYKVSLQGGNGGGAMGNTAMTKPKQSGKAKAIAKLLGTAAAVGGAGYLGFKAMNHLRNRWGNNNQSSSSPSSTSSPRPSSPRPSSPRPSSPSNNSSSGNGNIFQMGKYNIANHEEFNKAMNDPDFKFEF